MKEVPIPAHGLRWLVVPALHNGRNIRAIAFTDASAL